MAVSVIDLRQVIDNADTTTGWFNTDAVETSEIAEGTGCQATQVNIATDQNYFTAGSPIDMSGIMVYVQTQNQALRLGWQTGAHALLLGDGTNMIAFHMAGGDRDAFKHADTQVTFQSFVLDLDKADERDTAGDTTAIAGSYASFNSASLEDFGAHFITQSKALGGGQNCFIDVIRYGNDGIQVISGTTGDRGTLLEVVSEDRSKAPNQGHGVIRELTTDVYGLQSPITFGRDVGGGDSWFEDEGIILAYEDRYIADDKYYLKVTGSIAAADETNFSLYNSTVTTAGPFVRCDFAASGINALTLDTVVFSNLGNEVEFALDGYAASGHVITGCTFVGVGQLRRMGVVPIANCNINASTNISGAMQFDEEGQSDVMSNLSFLAGATGHAIHFNGISASGVYDFDNFTFTGFGANGTVDAAVWNETGVEVEINILNDGDSPTVLNSPGSTTTINNNVNVVIKTIDTDGNVLSGTAVYVANTSGVVYINTDTDDTGIASTSVNYAAVDIPIDIRLRRSSPDSVRFIPIKTTGTIDASGYSLTQQLTVDPVII